MKLAIVVGHNSRSQGAVSVGGVSEYVWNSRLALLIKDHDPDAVHIFHRNPGGGYSREIDRVYAEVDEWGADCSIELHFNGSVKPKARGVKTLTSGTKGSLALAEEVHSRYLAVMGRRDRGIETRTRHQRGGRSLWQGKCPAIMAEPFFGSNKEDWRRANARVDQLAEAIYRGAMAFYRAQKKGRN